MIVDVITKENAMNRLYCTVEACSKNEFKEFVFHDRMSKTHKVGLYK